MIHNWFAFAAGGCFFAAAGWALYSSHDWKLVVLDCLLGSVNVVFSMLK